MSPMPSQTPAQDPSPHRVPVSSPGPVPAPSPGSSHHLILGAGPVGRATASLLAGRGHTVVLVSRSGAGPAIPGVRRLPLDAADTPALTRAATGAAVIYNCMNPGDYTRWEAEWPPLQTALLAAAGSTGAVLATVSNLYMYGPQQQRSVLTPGSPEDGTDHKGVLRGSMDREALAAHRSGRIRAVIVRASDYVGTGVGANGMATRLVPGALAGKRAVFIGDPDLPHSWSDVDDVAATVVAAAADRAAHGRIWFAATNPPRSQRELLAEVLAVAGKPMVRTSRFPAWAVTALGAVVPFVRELQGVQYQFTGPWVIDATATERELGVSPTPWPEVLRRTAAGNGGQR
ncbi:MULTISPECIES: NAD-dependent epimerase/dehydratase family protein [Citricoccus]|uniref:NAD-dependent epimerase/dehydratase family protein n=1 Tax=Citricoccus TaxID=169133 RepID=UPI000255F686|nr:NAD-dependent epimerase/dehydratase family protein [Citricoccus sp. CH26A]